MHLLAMPESHVQDFPFFSSRSWCPLKASDSLVLPRKLPLGPKNGYVRSPARERREESIFIQVRQRKKDFPRHLLLARRPPLFPLFSSSFAESRPRYTLEKEERASIGKSPCRFLPLWRRNGLLCHWERKVFLFAFYSPIFTLSSLAGPDCARLWSGGAIARGHQATGIGLQVRRAQQIQGEIGNVIYRM